jgi:PKHD-type hydroxylase
MLLHLERVLGSHLLKTLKRVDRCASPLVENLLLHPLFTAAVEPKCFSDPVYSRLCSGEGMARRLEPAVSREPFPIRTDVLVSVFLCDASCYEGGELILETEDGEVRFKAQAGDCVIHPPSLFHRVEPVTKGIRLSAFLKVQSFVRDPEKRRILYDIACTIQELHVFDPRGHQLERLKTCRTNLLRRWSDV